MPFTPTHIVAVLPLDRRLPLAALAVGAMTPDFPLYFPFGPTYEATHSAAGIVTACLPMGLAIWLLYERLVREPIIALAPPHRQGALGSVRAAPGWRVTAIAALAVLVGALTHVVWDAFTHEGRWGTLVWPPLRETYALGPIRAPGYSWFQHGSSAVGLPLLAWLGWRRWTTAAPAAAPLCNRHRRLVLAVLLGLPAARGIHAMAVAPAGLGSRLYDLVTVGGRWLIASVIVYALAYRWRRHWFATPGAAHRR